MFQKTILFATDLAEEELPAFQQACVFALAWKAKLLIVHVEEAGCCILRQEESASRDLATRLHDIFPKNLAIEYEYLLNQGDPAQVLLEIEREQNVDLIVLGTHGRQGVNRMFGGSVAESIIRAAQCPVLTLRQQEPKQQTNRNPRSAKFLVPIDFSVYSYAALDFASSIANAMNASITILHVDESHDHVTINPDEPAGTSSHDDQHHQKIWAQLRAFRPMEEEVEFGHQLLTGLSVSQIASFAELNNFDYVVLGTHGRSGVSRALLGSVAEKIVRNADCPVITVKPSNKRSPVLHY